MLRSRVAVLIIVVVNIVSAAVLSNMVGIQGRIGGSKKLGSFMLQRQIDIDVLPNEDLHLEYQVSLDESFNGNELPFNLPVMFVNEHCSQKKCSMCNGKGAVFSTLDKFVSKNSSIVKQNKRRKKSKKKRRHQNTPCLTVQTASPCPICKGMGVLVDPAEHGCDGQLYHTIPTPLLATIPRGSRPGTVVTLPQKGHERLTYVHNESRAEQDSHLDIVKTRGKVELKVTKIYIDQYLLDREDRNATLSVESDHMEVTIMMSPAQALYGFKTNISYFNNKTLTIDRSGKITYPGSNSTVRGLGLPRVISTEGSEPESESESESEESSETGSTDTDDASAPAEELAFEDLIVKFKLIRPLADPENTYATQEEKDEHERIMLHCANNTNADLDLGTNSSGHANIVITPTGGESLVITGDIVSSSRLQMAGGPDADGLECSEEDARKFLVYEEDSKLRQLLRILTKRREEEEEEAARSE